VSGRRRAFIALAAGLALAGVLWMTRLRARPTPGASADTAQVEAAPAFARGSLPAPLAPTPAMSEPAADGARPRPLTPTGTARALAAITKNEQTRGVFFRAQKLGLSTEQMDRVVVVLASEALRPPPPRPTLEALRADGRSRVLSPEEGQRALDEQKRVANQTWRHLRLALSPVLTPAQLAQVGLDGAVANPPRAAMASATATSP
jgi:hypothetical protein